MEGLLSTGPTLSSSLANEGTLENEVSIWHKYFFQTIKVPMKAITLKTHE